MVAVGGTLAYATCSIFGCENDDVVDGFLSENTGFTCEMRKTIAPSAGSDGFYIAVLTRQT